MSADLRGIFDVDLGATEVDEHTAFRQSLCRRLITPRGRLISNPEYGTDIRAYVKASLTELELRQIEVLARLELEKDARVVAARVRATFLDGKLSLYIAIDATEDWLSQAFPLVVTTTPPVVVPSPVPPSVASASPVTDAGGTTTVTGSGFTPTAIVWTDGAPRSTVYVNATTLTAMAPPHVAGTVNLYVAQPSGNSPTIAMTYTASLIDPASKSLTLYLAQRGDTLDYTTATGTWTGRASAGPSGGRNLTQPTVGLRRTVSPAVDGKPLVRVGYSDGKTFANLPGTAADYYTSTEVAGIIVMRQLGSALPMQIAPYPLPWMLQDVSQWSLMVSLGNDSLDPGTKAVGIGRYNPGGGWSSALRVGSIPLNTIYAVCFRHEAGKLQLSVNAAPSALNEIACAASTNLASALQLLTTSSADADFVSVYLAPSLTDTDFDDIIAWEKAQLPTGYP